MANLNKIVIEGKDINTLHLLILNAQIYMGSKTTYSESDREIMTLMNDLLCQCTRIRNDQPK